MKNYLIGGIISFMILPAFCAAQTIAIPLSQVGASKAELKQRVIDSHKAKAKNWLLMVRGLPSNNSNTLKYLLEELKEANATLADIGTTATELDELAVTGYQFDIQESLKKAQEPDGTYLQHMKYLGQANATLVKIRADLKLLK